MSSTESLRIDDSNSAEHQFLGTALEAVNASLPRDAMVRQMSALLAKLTSADSVQLWRQVNGNWQAEHKSGAEADCPAEYLAESVDRSGTMVQGRWFTAPIALQTTGSDSATAEADGILVIASLLPEPISQSALGYVTRLSQVFASVLAQMHSRARMLHRIEQLDAVLTAAAEWQRLDDDEALLNKIADVATQLLNCTRASIFLWDKRRKKLVGRPALGVEGGQLEVDDSAGVVGEVLASGDAKIWNGSSDDESRVNRSVDQTTSFETKSLVAVPMHGPRGDMIGVFEAINHRAGGFEPHDATVLQDLATHASVAIDGLRTRKNLVQSRDRLVKDAAQASRMVGQHPALVALRDNAARVANTDLSVLILGENGTGKEVLAKHVHYESDRRSGPFVAVNCAALVESLLESELFGHEKGSFTDASQTRAGKFEAASGGTLFLDEIGDMSLGGQAKLLRVLEEKVVVRVGGSQTIPVDVRVIAATNQPLEQLIAEKRFREDLFFRLNVVPLTLPPLRDRGEDVLHLAKHFLTHFCYEIGRPTPTLLPNAQQALMAHPWPGNIRELRNTIERVCYLTNSEQVSDTDLMLSQSPGARLAAPGTVATSPVLADATRDFQIAHIEAAIEACRGNMTDAATRLGLHRSNLYRKMRQLGMSPRE